MPKVNSSARGDQYVNVIVDVPKKLNEKQVEALELFMEASGEEWQQPKETKRRFMGKIFGKDK